MSSILVIKELPAYQNNLVTEIPGRTACEHVETEGLDGKQPEQQAFSLVKKGQSKQAEGEENGFDSSAIIIHSPASRYWDK